MLHDPSALTASQHRSALQVSTKRPPVVVATSRHLVVDTRSRQRFLSFESSAWGDRTLKLSIGDLGSPVGVDVSTASDLAAAAGSIAGLAADVASSAADGVKLMETLQKARDDQFERQLARLERQRKRAELKTALDTTGSDIAAQRTVTELQRRKDELELRKAIADLEAPTPVAPPSTKTAKTISLSMSASES